MRIRRGRGFSLTELMIAIGILAVGMVMAGSLFPAAMQANRRSVANVLGSIICENGLAIAKARWAGLTEADFDDLTERGRNLLKFRDPLPNKREVLEVLADDFVTEIDFLSDADRTYPVGDLESKYGFVLMMRPMDDDDDVGTWEGYQLVATSYRRQLDNGLVVCKAISGSVIDDTVTSYSDYSLRAGSPVIDRYSGAFGVMTSAAPYSGKMDRAIETDEEVEYFFIVVETDPAIGGPDLPDAALRFSPAMATMVTRMGLTGDLVRRSGR